VNHAFDMFTEIGFNDLTMSGLNNLDGFEDELLAADQEGGVSVQDEEDIPDCPVDQRELGTPAEILAAHERKVANAGQVISFERISGSRADAHRLVTKMVGLDDSGATLEISPGIHIPDPGVATAGEW
jgi:hypothetical protein